jgi:P pilus assembly chaperone PapD
MSNYQQGTNWSAKDGNFSNGRGETINNPGPYFNSVASNSHGYNASYSNGHGVPIANPTPYFQAVSSDRHGYNGVQQQGKK